MAYNCHRLTNYSQYSFTNCSVTSPFTLSLSTACSTGSYSDRNSATTLTTVNTSCHHHDAIQLPNCIKRDGQCQPTTAAPSRQNRNSHMRKRTELNLNQPSSRYPNLILHVLFQRGLVEFPSQSSDTAIEAQHKLKTQKIFLQKRTTGPSSRLLSEIMTCTSTFT